jgi:HSP20 family protein
MNLVKHRGLRGGSLAHLRREMDDLFSRFLEDWPLAGLWGRDEALWPAIDVSDQDDKVVVKAELPGVTADEIELSVLDDTLTLSGEKKESHEDKAEGYYHLERRYGSFRRSVQLPTPVDADHVEAGFRDGVLTVTLPKDQKSRPRKIELKK